MILYKTKNVMNLMDGDGHQKHNEYLKTHILRV